MTQSTESLTTEIGAAVARIVQTDLALLAGYSEAKARSIASFTLVLGRAYAAGSLTRAQFDEESAELERMVVRFVRNLQALATTMIERLMRGLSDLLVGVIRRTTGMPALTLGPTGGPIWGVGAG